MAERAQTLPDWTPEELAELTCRFPGCTLLITLNNHFCDHHAEQVRKLRARRPPRRPAPATEGGAVTPIRLCLEPRCPNPATAKGRCDEHRKTIERNRSRVRRADARERNRMYARKRWELVRRHKLYLNPICELCDRTLANEVHHRIAMEDGGAKYDLENLISTCKPCHSRETRREQTARGEL